MIIADFEKLAKRDLLGNRFTQALRFCFWRTTRRRLLLEEIAASAAHKNVLVASARLWLADVERRAVKRLEDMNAAKEAKPPLRSGENFGGRTP